MAVFKSLFLFFSLTLFAPYFYVSSVVRELQQDIRDLNQADLPEVDPEENSAEFMGILIKVHKSCVCLLS